MKQLAANEAIIVKKGVFKSERVSERETAI